MSQIVHCILDKFTVLRGVIWRGPGGQATAVKLQATTVEIVKKCLFFKDKFCKDGVVCGFVLGANLGKIEELLWFGQVDSRRENRERSNELIATQLGKTHRSQIKTMGVRRYMSIQNSNSYINWNPRVESEGMNYRCQNVSSRPPLVGHRSHK